MLRLAFPAEADDDVVLKVHVRCRGCHREAYPLAPVNRPPPGVSALTNFRRRRLFERMAFTCEGCAHERADLVGVAYASADDLFDRSSPFAHLRSSWLMKMAAQQGEDCDAQDQ